MKKGHSHKTNRVLSFKKIFVSLFVVFFIFAVFFSSDGVGKGKANILFVGDMMFDRTMRKVGDAKGYDYFFSCVKEYVRSFDLAIGNLEGPITESASLSLSTKPGDPNNTRFTFDPAVANELSKHNFGMVSLGNNHIWDFGREGAESTMAALRDSGVLYFGAPNGQEVATTTVNGNKVAFISFNQFLGENRPEETVSAIGKARKDADFVFVYAHWGDEYTPATEYQKTSARRFIDAGADIVIGSHPHVIQEHEVYKGKHIFYSLGNFIFDQYWMEEVRTGGAVEVALQGDALSVKERQFDILRDGRVCLK